MQMRKGKAMNQSPEKSTEQIAEDIVGRFCEYTTGRGYCYTHEGKDGVCKPDSVLIKEALDLERTKRQDVEKELEAWQKMCEKFVGCSMLSDEFAGEPHDPESFGGYVQNLINQIESAILSEREEVLKELKQLSEDLFNACSDNPDLQLTWNSALRQSAYKVDALSRRIRHRTQRKGSEG